MISESNFLIEKLQLFLQLSGKYRCKKMQKETVAAENNFDRSILLFININRLFLKNLVEIGLGFGNVGLKFNWNVSGKMSKRAGMPFMNSNGKC